MDTREVISRTFKSKLFLAFTIGCTAIVSGRVLGALADLFIGGYQLGKVTSFLISLLIALPAILTAYYSWMLYMDNVSENNILSVKKYMTFIKVISVILTVLMAIVLFAMVLVGILMVIVFSDESVKSEIIAGLNAEISAELGAEAADTVSAYAEMLGASMVFLIIALVVFFGGFIFVLVCFSKMCKSVCRYFEGYSKAYADGYIYIFEKLPITRLWIFGALFGISGLASITLDTFSAISNMGAALMMISLAMWLEETNDVHVKRRDEINAEREREFEENKDNKDWIIL